MTREEFIEVEETFTELLQAGEAERERRLSLLRPNTRRLVRELLNSAERERADALAELRPRRLGAWSTVRRLGRGGMGEVWLARRADGAFEAEVAVKILAGPVQLDEFQERFRLERQILAALEHPNICRLLDGGVSEDGVPYLVMEHIDGLPIHDYCETHRLDAGAICLLMEQVCRAVSHAHSRLVLHRDLKPTNILVNGRGEVKLLDFGTAQLLEPRDKGLTGAAGRLLTPAYASPEMILGRPLSVASDVWSLGVLLHQLLTGRVPLRGSEATAERMLRLEPFPPAGINGDLDAMIGKALDPDPESRYSQAEDLRADLERWRQGLPVAARQGKWRYRAAKFVRRHWTRLAVAGTLLLAILAGAASTLYQSYVAARRYESVRALAENLVGEIFAQTQRSPGTSEAQRLLASRVIQALDPLARSAGGDPELDLVLARAYLRLARLQGDPYSTNFGDTKAALASLDRAAHLAAGDSASARTVQASLESARSGILLIEGRTAAANAAAQRAYALLQALPESAARAAEKMDLAGFLGDMAAASQPEAAERFYETAMRHYSEARRLGAQALDSVPLVLRVKLGGLWLERQPSRALEEFRKGLQVFAALPGPQQKANRRMEATLVRKESNALAALQRFPEARLRAEDSVRLARELYEIDKKDRRAQFDLVVAYNDQAILLENGGWLAEAREATGKALQLLRPMALAAGSGSPYSANLAEVEQRAARLAAGKKVSGGVRVNPRTRQP